MIENIMHWYELTRSFPCMCLISTTRKSKICYHDCAMKYNGSKYHDN